MEAKMNMKDFEECVGKCDYLDEGDSVRAWGDQCTMPCLTENICKAKLLAIMSCNGEAKVTVDVKYCNEMHVQLLFCPR